MTAQQQEVFVKTVNALGVKAKEAAVSLHEFGARVRMTQVTLRNLQNIEDHDIDVLRYRITPTFVTRRAVRGAWHRNTIDPGDTDFDRWHQMRLLEYDHKGWSLGQLNQAMKEKGFEPTAWPDNPTTEYPTLTL